MVCEQSFNIQFCYLCDQHDMNIMYQFLFYKNQIVQSLVSFWETFQRIWLWVCFRNCDMMFAVSLEAHYHHYDFQLLLIMWAWRIFLFNVRHQTMLLPTEIERIFDKCFRFQRPCKWHMLLNKLYPVGWKRLLKTISLMLL